MVRLRRGRSERLVTVWDPRTYGLKRNATRKRNLVNVVFGRDEQSNRHSLNGHRPRTRIVVQYYTTVCARTQTRWKPDVSYACPRDLCQQSRRRPTRFTGRLSPQPARPTTSCFGRAVWKSRPYDRVAPKRSRRVRARTRSTPRGLATTSPPGRPRRDTRDRPFAYYGRNTRPAIAVVRRRARAFRRVFGGGGELRSSYARARRCALRARPPDRRHRGVVTPKHDVSRARVVRIVNVVVSPATTIRTGATLWYTRARARVAASRRLRSNPVVRPRGIKRRPRRDVRYAVIVIVVVIFPRLFLSFAFAVGLWRARK